MLMKRLLLAATGLAALSACGGGGSGSSAGESGLVVVPTVPTTAPTATPTPTATATPVPVATATPTPTPSPTATSTPTASTEKRVVLNDNVNYTVGSYNAYAAPWCALRNASLVVGKDISTRISLLPSKFPNDIEIAAFTPNVNPHDYGCGVYGYHHVHFGNYSGLLPKGKFDGMQVSSLRTLVVDFAFEDTGSTGEYNMLNEYFLTAEKDRQDKRVMEIGYFFHPSQSAIQFAKSGKDVGNYTDAEGREWSVRQSGQFVMLMPADGQDLRSGSLDMAHFLQHLVKKGKLTGNEWFNGAAMGVEPVRGNSSVRIQRWHMTMS